MAVQFMHGKAFIAILFREDEKLSAVLQSKDIVLSKYRPLSYNEYNCRASAMELNLLLALLRN